MPIYLEVIAIEELSYDVAYSIHLVSKYRSSRARKANLRS